MSDPNGGTFIDIPKLLIDDEFMKSKLKYVTDQTVLDFWTKEWPDSQKSNESGDKAFAALAISRISTVIPSAAGGLSQGNGTGSAT